MLLVDDGSTDKTIAVAKKLGIKVFKHYKNAGYGANQKTCYQEALKLNPKIIVMLHPDYQYDASAIQDLITPILAHKYDLMFGSRIYNRKSALAGGMPKHKYMLNRIFCIIENMALGVNFTEHFSGFRAYSVDILKTIPFQSFSNDFIFDQQMVVSAISHGFRVGEIPIPTRYHIKASSIGFKKGSKFLLEILSLLIAYYLNRVNIKKSSIFY